MRITLNPTPLILDPKPKGPASTDQTRLIAGPLLEMPGAGKEHSWGGVLLRNLKQVNIMWAYRV